MKKIRRPLLICFILISMPCISSAFSFDELGRIDIHGFISQGYIDATDDTDYFAEGVGEGTFQFNEIGINFGTYVTEELRMGIQLIAFDLGNHGNDDIILDWAVADYKWRDWLAVKAGLIKIPHGLYNESRDIDFLRTSVFLSASVYGELWRDAFTRMKGIGLYGTVPFGISYKGIYGITSFEPDSGLVNALGGLFLFNATETQIKNTMSFAILWQTPVESLRFASSAYLIDDFEIAGTFRGRELGGVAWGDGAPLTLAFNSMIVATGSVEYLWHNVTIASEYTQYILDFEYAIPTIGIRMDDKIEMEGYYGSLSYRISEHFMTGLMYSEVYLNKNSKSGQWVVDNGLGNYRSDGYQKDFTLSLRVDINMNWLLKLELHKMKGTFFNVNETVDDDDDWLLYAAKITYFF